MFAAISLYMGCYYIILYILYRELPENLPFAISCLLAALLEITNAGMYSSSTLAEGMAWERWNFIEIPFLAISLVWFAHTYTVKKN